MQVLEQEILPNSYGLTSLRNSLNAHRPTGVTAQDIDDYLAYYFNL